MRAFATSSKSCASVVSKCLAVVKVVPPLPVAPGTMSMLMFVVLSTAARHAQSVTAAVTHPCALGYSGWFRGVVSSGDDVALTSVAALPSLSALRIAVIGRQSR